MKPVHTEGVTISIYLQGNAIAPQKFALIRPTLEDAKATLKLIASTKEDFLYIDNEDSGHPLIVNRNYILYAGIE